MPDERIKVIVKHLVEASTRYDKREDAKSFVEAELRKLNVSQVSKVAEAILKKGFDSAAARAKREYRMEGAQRKEAGASWSATTAEGSEEFEKGLRAVQVIRRGFHDDDAWNRMTLDEKYAFFDRIEKILKAPGKFRGDVDYETIKVELAEHKSDFKEIRNERGERVAIELPVDKIEEAALMALGVLRRRRGTERQIARMGERRRDQRREARNIMTYWNEPPRGERGGRAPREDERRGPGDERTGDTRTSAYPHPYFSSGHTNPHTNCHGRAHYAVPPFHRFVSTDTR